MPLRRVSPGSTRRTRSPASRTSRRNIEWTTVISPVSMGAAPAGAGMMVEGLVGAGAVCMVICFRAVASARRWEKGVLEGDDQPSLVGVGDGEREAGVVDALQRPVRRVEGGSDDGD